MVDLGLQARRLAAKAQTVASPMISLEDLARLLLEAGFTPEEATTMVAIAGAESGYRTEAFNVDKTHGSEDYGVFQINQIHKPDMSRIYDPAYNVEMAKKIYDLQGFTAWVAYDNNKHLPFMEAAEEAVSEAQASMGVIPWSEVVEQSTQDFLDIEARRQANIEAEASEDLAALELAESEPEWADDPAVQEPVQEPFEEPIEEPYADTSVSEGYLSEPYEPPDRYRGNEPMPPDEGDEGYNVTQNVPSLT